MVDRSTSLAVLVAGMVIYSIGISPVVILATDLIVGCAPVERAGAAGAISETSSELGGALGIAVLGSVGTAVYRAAMAHAVPAGVPLPAAEVARSTLGAALAEAGKLSGPVGTDLASMARGSFVEAFQVASAVCAGISIATAVMILLLLRRVRAGAESSPAAEPVMSS